MCSSNNQLAQLVDTLHAEFSDGLRMLSINDWVNGKIIYTVDLENRWQTPQETLQLSAGDCEDFAILKFAIASKVGIATRLVVVRDTRQHINHMVLEWNGIVYDNAVLQAREARHCVDYRPIYGFDHRTVYVVDQYWRFTDTNRNPETIDLWNGVLRETMSF